MRNNTFSIIWIVGMLDMMSRYLLDYPECRIAGLHARRPWNTRSQSWCTDRTLNNCRENRYHCVAYIIYNAMLRCSMPSEQSHTPKCQITKCRKKHLYLIKNIKYFKSSFFRQTGLFLTTGLIHLHTYQFLQWLKERQCNQFLTKKNWKFAGKKT